MINSNLYYPILVLLLFVAEEIYFLIATKFNIIDRISERGSNRLITLCGGGIIFYIAALLYMLFIPGQWAAHGLFFLGLSLVSIISFIDDIKEVSSIYRLIVQFVAVICIFFQWHIFAAYPWWFIVAVLVFYAGTINAYNFMDGVNGMTAAYSLVTLVAISYINQYILPSPVIPEVLLHTMTFAVLIFSFYNFRSCARCLAGDVGSVSIAFFVIYALGSIILATGDYYYLALLLVYGTDTVLTILHRIILRENITQPHRKHLYQILANELHWNHLAVSSLYMVVQAVITIGLFLVPVAYKYYYVAICLLLLMVAYIAFMRKHFAKHYCKKV